MEYACDSPWERRFYSMKVTPLEGTAKGVVVSHTDITQRRLIGARSANIVSGYSLR